MAEKYVAYIGSSTNINGNDGLSIFNVDVNDGKMENIGSVPANNASYLKISHDGKFLYVLVDEGVSAFRILGDGMLEHINTESIRGMRGCYLDIHKNGKFMFVAGMYDGKATVLRIKPDGSVGAVTENYFNKGMGSVAETDAAPHVTCVKPTPDGKFVCMVDAGMNQIKIMKFNAVTGKMNMIDMVHCEQKSGPRKVLFDKEGRFMYVIFGKASYVKVYSYNVVNSNPVFEEIQKISTARKDSTNNTILSMRLSHDGDYLLCSNGGDNSVAVFERDKENGTLKELCILPISGAYPSDIGMIPETHNIYSVNYEEETVTLFKLNAHKMVDSGDGRMSEKNYFAMYTRPIKVSQPNCLRIVKISDN